MDLSFVETMRGWLRAKSGAVLPVSFELVARGGTGGLFGARGVLSFPPLAPETAARGTLQIRPGEIAYRLGFVGARGEPLRLEATKHPSLLSPLASMTRMVTTVRAADGGVLAVGDMRFDLRDLPSFLTSWLPFGAGGEALVATRRRAFERHERFSNDLVLPGERG